MLVESIRSLYNNLTEIVDKEINEAFVGGHAPHPEDDVYLKGSKGSLEAMDAILKTFKKPQATTIKWDGYPALIFGRGNDGKFIIADKHMFNKSDGSGRQIFNPEQFIQYDALRGVARPQLADVVGKLWPHLDYATKGQKGYYWGDLLFSQPLQDINGKYKFKANPNGITYEVDVDSNIGKMLTDKIAGIGIHQFIDADAPANAESMSKKGKKVAPTDLAISLNGTTGKLGKTKDVAILPSAMPVIPKVDIPTQQIKDTQKVIQQYGPALDKLLPGPGSQFKNDIGVFFNNKIRSGNLNNLLRDFYKFFKTRKMTVPMRKKVEDHLAKNKDGVIALLKIWSEIYKLKMILYKQLDDNAKQSPVKGYLDDGTLGQEGYVAHGHKYVDRMGFSRQNLAGQR